MALTDTRLTTVASLVPARGDYPIAANTRIFKGAQVGLDSAGGAVNAGTLASGCVQVIGKASHEVDNRTGSELGGAAGAALVSVEFGVIGWDNSGSDPVTAADVGQVVYSEDEQTIARTGSSTLARSGLLTEIGSDGQAYVWQGPHVAAIVEADALAEAGVALQKRTVTIGHADLEGNDVDGAASTVNIGAVLPANARVIGAVTRGYTPFTGGGLSAVALDIGTAGDIDAIVDGADAFAAAVDGGTSTLPPGISPNKLFVAAGAQLIATLTPDGGHDLQDATAGAVTIDVLFSVLA